MSHCDGIKPCSLLQESTFNYTESKDLQEGFPSTQIGK